MFHDDDPEFRGYRVPEQLWKIAVIDLGNGDYRVLSYMLSQDFGDDPDNISAASIQPFDPATTQVSIEEIEALTGLDFGPIRDYTSGLAIADGGMLPKN